MTVYVLTNKQIEKFRLDANGVLKLLRQVLVVTSCCYV